MKNTTLLSFFKHTFIPHKGNDYKPHFFREHVILTFLIGSIFLLLLSFTSYIVIQTTAYGSSVVSSVLIDLTNQTREEHNLPPLLYNRQLKDAATMKGDDMVTKQYFAHFAPDGTTPWYWFEKAGYSFLYAGENLAINFRSSKEVERAWLASPKHRDNILGGQYEDIGIATVKGTENGKPVLFVVQEFGKSNPSDRPNSLTRTYPLGSPHFYEKLLFNMSYYIDTIYTTLICILIVSLFMMILIEIKQQHYLHILYGVLIVIVIGICIGINSLLI
jgi:hypothetical protein